MTWWQALIQAGAVAGGSGQGVWDEGEIGVTIPTELVEGSELEAHPIPEPRVPNLEL